MSEQTEAEKPQRIAKFIAACGYCSRREAEKLIEQGKVKLDGKVLQSPATLVLSSALVEINGEKIKPQQEVRLFLFHKPAGYITSRRDEQNRKTIYDILPKNLPRLVYIGRLDFNTEGLLLLTTSGELSRQFELPENKMKRVYRVRCFGDPNNKKLAEVKAGCEIDGVRYQPAEVEFDPIRSRNFWLKFSIHEGKNREIRKLCEYIGLEVSRLIRISYGNFQLENLPSGAIKEVDKNDIKFFLENINASNRRPAKGQKN